MRWWIRILSAIIALALMLWLGWNMIQGIAGLLRGGDLNMAEPDPMFAQEAVLPTRPPHLDAEESVPQRPTLDDFPMEEGAPVDKTADELIREAQQKANSANS